MTFKRSTKMVNPNPCCTLTEFAREKGLNYQTLQCRAMRHPLPAVQFTHTRLQGQPPSKMYRVDELKAWLKAWDEKHT